MRSARIALATCAVLLIAGLAACATEDQAAIVMPDVTNARLDVALSDIERVGFEDEVDVVGGGLFGILDESNWMVCEQLPEAGTAITDAPRLTVDRNCGDPVEAPTGLEATSDAPVVEETSDASPTETTSIPPDTESESPDSETELPAAIDAQAIEAKFLEHLHNNFIDDISDMCDDGFTHWACFYDGVEDGGSYLRVNLTTDGGWPDSALEDMAMDAGRHWFNFIGCDFPNLTTIVVRVNGLDHNVFRWDTNADALCD